MKRICHLLIFIYLLVALGYEAFAQDAPISILIEQYQADRGALERKYNIELSDEYFDRMAQFRYDYLNELAVMDFNNLEYAAQVDYLAFKNYLNKESFQLELDKKAYKEVSHVALLAAPLYTFIRERRRGDKPDAKLTAQMLSDVANELERVDIAEMEKFKSWQQAELAADVIYKLRKALGEALKFYLHYDVDFTWWVEKPSEAVMQALRDYGNALQEHYDATSQKDDGSGIIGRPIGRAAIIRSLEFEMIPYTPEELIAAAEKQFAWCEKEMLKASNEVGHGDDWKAALEQLKNSYVEPGYWPQQINTFAEESIEYVESNNLISVPDLAKETWRMYMLSAKQQKTAPFFLGGESVLIAYPVDSMSHEDKLMSMRGNNPHFARAVVHHELIPGHHLQQFMNQRYQTQRRLFYNPFWMEGWALYWEMNLWDKGFAQTPEDRVGMLFWRMHRCARIIFSLNYHLQKMTPQQCIDYLVDKVGHERANAEAEVRRSFTGGYGPLYQIAYMVGGMQFMKLRVDLVDSGKMTEKAFHDHIMQQNTLPIELVRATLIQQPLTKDFETNWKFLKQ